MGKSTIQAATDERLGRIETKIDKLADAFIALAHVEEKLISLDADKKVLAIQVEKIDDRVTKVEKQSNENKETVSIITRIIWACIFAAITTLVGLGIMGVWNHHVSQSDVVGPAAIIQPVDPIPKQKYTK